MHGRVEIEQLLPLLFIGVFVTVFALVILAVVRQQKRARENLSKLADRLGFQVIEPEKRGIFNRSATRLSGVFRGRNLQVYAYSTGSGKNQTQWCALATPVRNPAGLTVRISRENIFTRVGRKLGIDDVETGDAAFDKAYYVKSNQPDFIRVALIPEVRQRIASAWESGARGTLSADAGEVKYAEVGNFSNEKVCTRFGELIEVVCDLGEVVEAFPG
ncbi:MAG TPA: hypothetical protein VGA56_06660 [Opitutaceae bacterium]